MAKPKSAAHKKQPAKSKAKKVETTKHMQPTVLSASGKEATASMSKQAQVIAMLQSPAGATIAAMVQATEWQQHSVRGFLAGVVRKRLKLKLTSKKVDGTRVYRIGTGRAQKKGTSQSKRRTA